MRIAGGGAGSSRWGLTPGGGTGAPPRGGTRSGAGGGARARGGGFSDGVRSGLGGVVIVSRTCVTT